MSLRDFPGDKTIFVDAGIFVLHFAGVEPNKSECRDFLKRIELGQIKALTVNFVIDEVIYSLLITKGSEIAQSKKIKTIQKKIKEDKVFAATCYKEAEIFLEYLEILRLSGLSLEDVNYQIQKDSIHVGSDKLLLPHDALYVKICQNLGIADIATTDLDFQKADFLTIWKPGN